MSDPSITKSVLRHCSDIDIFFHNSAIWLVNCIFVLMAENFDGRHVLLKFTKLCNIISFFPRYFYCKKGFDAMISEMADATIKIINFCSE